MAGNSADQIALENRKQDFLEAQSKGQVDNAGSALASSFGQTFGDYNDSYAGLQSAHSDLTSATADVQKAATDPQFSVAQRTKAGLVTAVQAADPSNAESVAAATALNSELSSSQQAYQQAQQGFAMKSKQYQGATSELQRNGFVPDFDNGEIVHLKTGNRYDYMGDSGQSDDDTDTSAPTPAASTYFNSAAAPAAAPAPVATPSPPAPPAPTAPAPASAPSYWKTFNFPVPGIGMLPIPVRASAPTAGPANAPANAASYFGGTGGSWTPAAPATPPAAPMGGSPSFSNLMKQFKMLAPQWLVDSTMNQTEDRFGGSAVDVMNKIDAEIHAGSLDATTGSVLKKIAYQAAQVDPDQQ
jgi:hypothetical protein